ncbi:BTAD domain-containing putative transcriptional regulator [Streptomyces sp. NPDC057445]|uniref:AfsR/SARP family transcriptional regulator n=1 Tax=Streptomyces sp. NPDC057445 TaxID=3346136 RepID=UPI0036BB740F
MQLDIRLLGSLEISLGDHRVDVTAPRLQSVLGSLLLHAGDVVPVSYLVESVWEGDTPADPVNQVAACVSMLRRKFAAAGAGKNLLVTQAPGYRFDAGGARLDTVTAMRLRAAAQEAVAQGDPGRALPVLKEALSLWRGPVLSGTNRRVWLPEVHRWEEEYVALRTMRSDIQLRLGLHEELIPELSVFVQRYPLLEKLRGVLMLALARSGRQADALQMYRETADHLREELGVTPGEELSRLHEQILRGTLPSAPSAVRTAAPLHAAATAPPAAPSEAVPARRPSPGPPPGFPPAPASGPMPPPAPGPVAPGPRTGTGPCQLPGDLAEFTGRQEEVAAVQETLVPASRSVPLVLLVGQGGTGKTALALHAAHRLRPDFPDGQLYVNLRGMSDDPVPADEALARFLRELGLPGPLPETLDERAEAYRSLLADRRTLIVLDDAGDAQQVLPLLPGTATSAVIVTSRSRLATIPSTRVLELEVFRKEQALSLLALLIGRARTDAEPEVAARLVEYCGRLPLAVRILGAKLASKPHWPLRKAAARLADERRRLDELAHENLEVRASLELSHQGISPAARRLFRRLALVAAADFADWVCAPLMELPLVQAEDLLEELLDARLLDVVSPEGAGELRYRMHDLVRLYALEQVNDLEPRDERLAALTRLGMTTLALADRAHRLVCGGDFTVVHNLAQPPSVPADILERVGADPLAWYEADRFAVTALCQQLAEQGQDELAWDLAATCRCQFSLRFHFDEWKATHEVALEAARSHGNERGTAAMLLGLGDLHLTKRNYARALPLLEESRTLFRKVGDDHGYALALRKAACADRIQGRFEQALDRWRECLPILRAAGDIEAQAQVLRWSGQTLLELGEPDQAEDLLYEAARITEGFHGRSTAQVRLSLGEHHLSRGELEQAEREFTRGLRATFENGDLSGHCHALWGLGWIDVQRGRCPEAEDRLQRARSLSRRIQDPLLESDVVLGLAAVCRISGRTADAVALLEEGAALCRQIEAPARLERFLKALAELSRPREDANAQAG